MSKVTLPTWIAIVTAIACMPAASQPMSAARTVHPAS